MIKIYGSSMCPACIDEDGTVFTEWEGYLRKLEHEPVSVEEGQACSIDHKGC